MFELQHKQMCELYRTLQATQSGHKSSANRNNYELPAYEMIDFMNWVYAQENFNDIVSLWNESNFNPEYRPKIKLKELKTKRYVLDNFILSNVHNLKLEYEATKK